MSYVVTESGIVQVSVRPACQKPAPIMFQTQVIIFFLQNEEDEEDEAKRASRAGSVWQKSIILSSEQAAANNGAMPKKVSTKDNLTLFSV